MGFRRNGKGFRQYREGFRRYPKALEWLFGALSDLTPPIWWQNFHGWNWMEYLIDSLSCQVCTVYSGAVSRTKPFREFSCWHVSKSCNLIVRYLRHSRPHVSLPRLLLIGSNLGVTTKKKRWNR